MNPTKGINNTKGFTLIELLIVMVIMGLVITAVYSTFLSSQRTTNTSVEVVDVQQNLRVAMETLTADIRMAGFLVPPGTLAISAAPDDFGLDENGDGDFDDTNDSDTFFTLQTIASMQTYARVLSADADGITVETDMASLLDGNDNIHVIRPSTNTDVTGPLVIDSRVGSKLNTTTAGYTSTAIDARDIVIQKLAGEPAGVTTITYWLQRNSTDGDNVFELRRDDGSTAGATLIATNINSIDLTYILEDGSEVQSVTTDFENIRAIRINISGQTDNTQTGIGAGGYSAPKTRRLQTVVKIQNAFGG